MSVREGEADDLVLRLFMPFFVLGRAVSEPAVVYLVRNAADDDWRMKESKRFAAPEAGHFFLLSFSVTERVVQCKVYTSIVRYILRV